MLFTIIYHYFFVANSNGVQLFSIPDQVIEARPNKLIIQSVNGNFADFFCVGRSGHEDLELFSEDTAQFGGPNTQLQNRLRDFRGMPGTHEFRVGEVITRYLAN